MQYDESTAVLKAAEATTMTKMTTAEVDSEPVKEVTAAHDLIAGGIAGSASVVVGHPFDTIKVRMQTGSTASFTSIASLFRGMAAPLSTAAAVNAIIFAAYGTSSRWWDQYITHSDTVDLPHDPWHKAFVCGSFAGLCQAMVICPMEHLKCRLQVQQGPHKQFRGPTQLARSIYKSHGIPGLYRGFHTTLWREVPAFGAYFSVYDIVKDYTNNYFDQHGEPHEAHSWIASGFAGGVSGCFTWIMIYPIDVIKTRIQISPIDTPSPNMFKVGRSIIMEHGWRYMFRGLGITLVRAFPVNGIIFPVYEFTLSHLTNLE